MRNVENGIQMGNIERDLCCDVSPGLGSGISMEQMQTGHINCMACKEREKNINTH